MNLLLFTTKKNKQKTNKKLTQLKKIHTPPKKHKNKKKNKKQKHTKKTISKTKQKYKLKKNK